MGREWGVQRRCTYVCTYVCACMHVSILKQKPLDVSSPNSAAAGIREVLVTHTIGGQKFKWSNKKITL